MEGGIILGRIPKPITLKEGALTKEEKERRESGEKLLQGDSTINLNPPSHLCAIGKRYYKEIVTAMPEGILNSTDSYTVTIVADALAKMQRCITILNKDGLIVEYTNKAGATNADAHKAIGIYQKYSQIFNTFATKLGLSPADRAKLAMLNVVEEDDEILKLLNS